MTTEPDMIAQAGEILRRFQDGEELTSWDGLEPADIVTGESAIVIAAATSTPAQPAQPDALTRIAVALEDIAHTLNEISDRGSGIDFSTKLYSR